MFFRENPVLTRELLVNLRSPQSFVIQFAYVVFLGVVVYFYWPGGEDATRQVSSGVARRLFEEAGAGLWAARTREELGRIGGRRAAPSGALSATEAAIAQCKAGSLEVPDLSGEVKQLVKVPPFSP